jgi:predicted RNase H-like HicB family nuclease
VVVTREKDGRYSGCAPALDGCGSFGDTLPECLQMTEEAIRLCIDCRRELGWPVAPDDPRVEVDMSEYQEAFVYRLTIRELQPSA